MMLGEDVGLPDNSSTAPWGLGGEGKRLARQLRRHARREAARQQRREDLHTLRVNLGLLLAVALLAGFCYAIYKLPDIIQHASDHDILGAILVMLIFGGFGASRNQ